MPKDSLPVLFGEWGRGIRFSTWLGFGLAVVFVCGYTATVSSLADYALPYCFALLTVLLATYLMVKRLGPPSMTMAPLWFCWGYFIVAYCAKFFLILLYPNSPAVMGTVGPLCQPVGFACVPAYVHVLTPYDWTTPAAEAKAIVLTALGISAFCLAAASFPSRTSQPCASLLEQGARLGYANVLLLLALALSVVTAFLFHKYQIGVMGVGVQVSLPYKMRGIVFYARTIFLPGLLLLVAAISWGRRSYGMLAAAIGLLLINGALDAVLRSSRGALLSVVLMLFFFAFVVGLKVRLRVVLFGALLLLPILTSIPYLSAYRVSRLELDVWDALGSAVAQVGLNPFANLAKGIAFVFYRFTGVDVLASMLGHEARPIGHYLLEVLISDRGVSGYLSTDVFGIPVDYPNASAPGFIGWCYLVAGVGGVVLGGAGLAIAVKYAWSLLLRYAGPAALVARVFFLLLLFTAVSEGTVDTLVKQAFVMCFTVLLLDYGMRLQCRQQSQAHSLPM